jgi:hypothetical protein
VSPNVNKNRIALIFWKSYGRKVDSSFVPLLILDNDYVACMCTISKDVFLVLHNRYDLYDINVYHV